MNKDEDEVYQLYETLSENSIDHALFAIYDRQSVEPKKGELYKVQGYITQKFRSEVGKIQ